MNKITQGLRSENIGIYHEENVRVHRTVYNMSQQTESAASLHVDVVLCTVCTVLSHI